MKTTKIKRKDTIIIFESKKKLWHLTAHPLRFWKNKRRNIPYFGHSERSWSDINFEKNGISYRAYGIYFCPFVFRYFKKEKQND